MSAQAAAETSAMTGGFKAAFGAHPAGVAVITADPGTGPVGITASSVASVSAAPPILAFSLAAGSGSAAAIAASASLVVHLLTADDVALARTFADPASERFTGAMVWTRLATGEPLLLHSGFALRCEALSRTPAGGSLLVAASVVEIISPDAAAQGAPLVYHARNFYALDAGTLLPGA